MNNTTTNKKNNVIGEIRTVELDVLEEGATKAGLDIMTPIVGLIGAWSLSCMIGALVKFGPVEMFKGFFTALTGM